MKKEEIQAFGISIITHIREKNFRLAESQWKLYYEKMNANEIQFLKNFLTNNQFSMEIFSVFEGLLTDSNAIISVKMLNEQKHKILNLKPIVEFMLPLIAPKELTLENYIHMLAMRQYAFAQFYFIDRAFNENEELNQVKMINTSNLTSSTTLSLWEKFVKTKIDNLMLAVGLGFTHLNNLVSKKLRSNDIDKKFILGLASEIHDSYQKIIKAQIKQAEEKIVANLFKLKNASEEIKHSNASELFKMIKPQALKEGKQDNPSVMASFNL